MPSGPASRRPHQRRAPPRIHRPGSPPAAARQTILPPTMVATGAPRTLHPPKGVFRPFDRNVAGSSVSSRSRSRIVMSAFEVNSIDYLLKPVEEQPLERALTKLERL